MWYNPSTGTFTSVDPWEGDPQSPMGLHRYLYVNQSPVTFSDPRGEFLVEAIAVYAIVASLHAIRTRTIIETKDIEATFFRQFLNEYAEPEEIPQIVNDAIRSCKIPGFAGIKFKEKSPRYTYSIKFGWIDLKHIVATYSIPLGQGFILGFFWEVGQAMAFDFHKSAFRKDDFLSNAIGTAASTLKGASAGENVMEILNTFVPVVSKGEAERAINDEK